MGGEFVDLQTQQLLQMMDQPVFYVKDGVVIWHNRAATNLVFQGQNVLTLFLPDGAPYSLWDRMGSMEAEIPIFGIQYGLKARVLDGGELFVLEPRSTENRGRGTTLLQTSAHLRGILQDLIDSVGTIQDNISDREDLIPEAETLNRSCYRLLSLCNRLSDGGTLMRREGMQSFQKIRVREFLDRFVSETAPLLKEAGYEIEYTPCNETITCHLEPVLIERGLYRLLAHGIKHSAPTPSVSLSAWDDEQRVCFAISYAIASGGEEIFLTEGAWNLSDIPGTDGIGMEVVRLIAEYHGGTLMGITSAEGQRIRLVLSIGKNNATHNLRSCKTPHEEFDGFHRGLVELSEILGKEMYHPDQV